MNLGIGDHQIDLNVRSVAFHIGALSGLLSHLVHQGILQLKRGKLGVGEMFGVDRELYGKALSVTENLMPGKPGSGCVQLIRIAGREAGNGHQDLECGGQAQTSLVEKSFVAREADGPVECFDFPSTQFEQLTAQKVLVAFECLGDEDQIFPIGTVQPAALFHGLEGTPP